MLLGNDVYVHGTLKICVSDVLDQFYQRHVDVYIAYVDI